jgi:hypothetical protein
LNGLRLVPLDIMVGIQRRWPVRELWAIGLILASTLLLFGYSWSQVGLDLALFTTGAYVAMLLALGETLRDRGKITATRIWWVLAEEWKMDTTHAVERTVHRKHRSQRVKTPKDIPAKRKASDGHGKRTPRVKVVYKRGAPRWRQRGPEWIDYIDGNYHGSGWRDDDPRTVARARARLESKLQITLRTVHTSDMKLADHVRWHQAAPLPDQLTLEHLKAAYYAGGADLRARLIVGFVAPDTTGPHIVPVTFADPLKVRQAIDQGQLPPEPQTFYVLAVDPRKVPHFRVHGVTGRGKTVTLDDLIYAFLLYGSSHGTGQGGVLAADCKLAGTFVKWKHSGQVQIPRTEQDIVNLVHRLKELMDIRAERLNRDADEIVDAWNAGAEPPLVPTFEPVLSIIDEYASLMRWIANQDAQARAAQQPTGMTAQFLSDLADLIQKGRALDMHVGVSSQSANVEGAGGAKFPSDVRAQAELVIHMGPTSEEAGRTTYGTKDGAEWVRLIPDLPGYAGVAVGPIFYIAKMPDVYDPVTRGRRNARVDATTRLGAWLGGSPPPAQEPQEAPEAPEPDQDVPTIKLLRLGDSTAPIVDAEDDD